MMTATDDELERVRAQVAELVRTGDTRGLRALRDRLRVVVASRTSTGRTRAYFDAYGAAPSRWAHEVIDWPDGQELAGYQDDVLTALAARRRAAVRGPHGLGKSAVSALTVLWFATTREAGGLDWKVLTTASAWRHLSVYLWPEIHKWARRIRWELLGRDPFTQFELLSLNLKLALGAASAVASNKPELIEGAHADSLLYVIDEAKIVPNGTWDAIEGAFAGGRTQGYPEAFALAISTPGPPAGRFYDIHSRKPGLEDWWVRHVRVDEAIAAGRISPEWVDARRRQWGADSALFHNRVLGEFHASDEDAVVPLAWAEAAVERWHAWDAQGRPPLEGWRTLGVDVARGGADKTVLARRHGPAVIALEEHEREDTMRTVARVAAARGADAGNAAGDGAGAAEVAAGGPAGRPGGWVPVVDSIGVGGGVVDRLRELGVPVIAYTGSAKTARRTRDREHGFVNVRSAAYWNVRELLDPAFEPVLMLPPDEMLLADLTAPTWQEKSGVPPKIAIEPKAKLVERLGRSPDKGDAVVMALFAEALGTGPRAHSPARAGAGAGAGAGRAAARYGRPVQR